MATPCPVRVRAPSVVSILLRSHPYPRFRVLIRPWQRLTGGQIGEIGQLGVLPAHHRQHLVTALGAAAAELRVQIMGPPPSGPGPVPHLGADRTASSLDPSPGHGDPPDRPGQQARVGGDLDTLVPAVCTFVPDDLSIRTIPLYFRFVT